MKIALETGSILPDLRVRRKFLIFLLLLFSVVLNGQQNHEKVSINGYVSHTSGRFVPDKENGNAPDNLFRTNNYAWLRLSYRALQAGFRYEAYLPPLPGYDAAYRGHGLANLFGMYTKPRFSLTLGSFYEQFGSGLILRAYENQQLGIDNSMAGAKCSMTPFRGLLLKTFIGRQRDFWSLGKGVVKGVDGEWNISESMGKSSGNQWIAGMSMVSRYQKDNDPLYKLPENVAAFSGRLSFSGSRFQLSGEYGYKINDPSALNNLIYKNGQALILTGSVSSGRLGILLTGKWVDNMDFRSERGATGNRLTLGFMPGVPAEHTYALAGMYPYVSQLSGEATIHSEINWTLEKGSVLGGPWGTSITLQLALAQSIRKEPADPAFPVSTPGTKGYHTSLLALGETKYFRDLSLEISRKLSRNFKSTAGFTRLFYNISALQLHPGEPDVTATTFYADLSFRVSPRKNLRTELQHLYTEQDKGSWALGLLEYSPYPGWSLALADQYNYGNPVSDDKKHYLLLNLTMNRNAHHLNLSLGRQREGVVCVGGVCRYSPEYSGFTLSYRFTFYN